MASDTVSAVASTQLENRSPIPAWTAWPAAQTTKSTTKSSTTAVRMAQSRG